MRPGANTQAVHGDVSGARLVGPLSEPLNRATTFGLPTAEAHPDLYRSRADGFYQRFGHPTVSAAADRVCALEGGDRGLMFGSGMGAISTVLHSLLRTGDRLVAHHELFAQTSAILDHMASAWGLSVTYADLRKAGELRKAITANTRVVYVETPTNPLLEIVDIQAVSAAAGPATVVVDSTFASPVVQQPLRLGASIVVHSGTKFLGGHSDAMCGFAVGHGDVMSRVRDMQVLLGTVADPMAAWLVLRSLPTLPMRVHRQCDTASAIAAWLSVHPEVARVLHPSLATDPGHATAKGQMLAGGAVLCFEPRGGVMASRRLLNELRLITIATSLGGVHTVAELPYDLDFRDEEIPVERGRSPALIRISVGLEDSQDLIADLAGALAVT